uniref:SMODS and SLOG-associating 2TM effector domain-containing protein n=1 Tax=viral metagenome TaxID=1070528 RepID=A0A6C0BTD6_9ZZZZ
MTNKTKIKWTPEQQRLLINWAEKATGYAWLHNRSVNYFKNRNLYIAIPASFFGYIAGATSFISSSDGGGNIYISTMIGVCGILAGLLTNFQEIFTFKELGEQHRISALRFLSFFRDISCELSIHPNHRTDPIEYITMKRMELDKLLEQSPMPPQSIINEFNRKFKKVQIHKPDLANNLQTIIPYGAEMCNKTFEPLKTKKQLLKKYFKIWKKNVLETKHTTGDGLMEVANSETSSIIYNPNDHININVDNINVDTASSETVSSQSENDKQPLVVPIFNDELTRDANIMPFTDIIARSRASQMLDLRNDKYYLPQAYNDEMRRELEKELESNKTTSAV